MKMSHNSSNGSYCQQSMRATTATQVELRNECHSIRRYKPGKGREINDRDCYRLDLSSSDMCLNEFIFCNGLDHSIFFFRAR